MINDVRYKFLYQISPDKAVEHLMKDETRSELMKEYGSLTFIDLCIDLIKVLEVRDTSEDYRKAAVIKQVLQGVKMGIDMLGQQDEIPQYDQLPDYPKE